MNWKGFRRKRVRSNRRCSWRDWEDWYYDIVPTQFSGISFRFVSWWRQRWLSRYSNQCENSTSVFSQLVSTVFNVHFPCKKKMKKWHLRSLCCLCVSPFTISTTVRESPLHLHQECEPDITNTHSYHYSTALAPKLNLRTEPQTPGVLFLLKWVRTSYFSGHTVTWWGQVVVKWE